MSKIIVLVGPTASGKTKISIELAKYYNAEIINADSRYIYKEPSIATAKVSEEEMSGIKHHMIDIISLNNDYSIYEYQKEARNVLNDLISQNKNVIVVGGSGLYIKALLYDYKLEERVFNEYDFSKLSNIELKEKVDSIYSMNNIHVNNRKRLENFLKHYYDTGNIITKTDSVNNKVYDFILTGLNPDKEKLRNEIDNRVDLMINSGLIDEAKSLMNYKHFNDIIGYKELNSYFNDEISLETAINNIKTNTKKYAKRQMTWFNNQMEDIMWFNTNYDNIHETINNIKEYIDETYTN